MSFFSSSAAARAKVFDAGGLDRRITIESLTVAPGTDYGEPTETWTTFKKVWAAVLPMTGRELAVAQQISGEMTVKFIIRWLSGVKDNMRILYDSVYYDIFRVEEVGRQDAVEIWAKARKT
jgi:SPP1 family predicted phage head-tail adaptor